jgi:hypothetical protein
MSVQYHPPFMSRQQLIQILARFRKEWEEAAEGDSLLDLEVSVGLLLADLAMALNLTPHELSQALGENLVDELQEILIPVPGGNGNH